MVLAISNVVGFTVFFLFFVCFRGLQAAFNKIPSGGGPLLPLLNTAIVLGAVGYCGYNSVFTGETWYGMIWYGTVG